MLYGRDGLFYSGESAPEGSRLFIYDDGWGKKSKARIDDDFVYREGLAFPVAMTCGNFKAPHESPYGFGCYVYKGPVKTFRGDDILTDYDDRLRQFYPDKWRHAAGQLKARLEDASLPKLSKFLSELYGKKVKCLQVLRGCNVGNGYPYLIFVSQQV
jgi:hypothetical protein